LEGPTWTFSVDASSSGPHAPKVVRDAARTQTARPELDAARKALATRAASSSKTPCVADPTDPTTRSRGEGSMDPTTRSTAASPGAPTSTPR